MTRLDEVVDRWESLLQTSEPVDLGEYWSCHVTDRDTSTGERSALLFELIALELEYSWRNCASHSCRRASDFLPLLMTLGEAGLWLPLIAEEYRVRQRFGDRPTHAMMMQEFPAEADRLTTLLRDVDHELKAEFHNLALVSDRVAIPLPRSEFDPRAPLWYGDYLVQRFLGAGSLGRVYVARQHSMNRSVALKFLRKQFLHDQAAVERFLQEGRLAGSLTHPGIVTIHGLGRTPGGSYFLAMDLVSGGPLTIVDLYDPNALRQTLEAVLQAAEATSAAHAQGVVHCDLKPANILREATGRVVVTDFGLARQLNERASVPLGLEGTPAFIAPEQVSACWGAIGEATDVFNLGATLFWLLTGESPHPGANAADLVAHAVSGANLKRLQDRQPRYPAAIDEFLAQTLQKPLSKRLGTMNAFAAQLRRVVQSI